MHECVASTPLPLSQPDSPALPTPGLLAASWQSGSICRIVLHIAPILEPIEDALCTKFLPAILGPDITIDDDLHDLLALGVKGGGKIIQNPTLIVDLLFHTSQDATSYFFRSLLCNKLMCPNHHRSAIHTAAASSRKQCRNGKDTFLHALLVHLPPKVKKCLECAGTTGTWLTTISDRFSGTELTKTKWFDNITLRYGFWPPHLPF
ncbi:hypothetical protein ACHAW6_000780 [Cyclotella cf. meneghiniana]